MVVMSMAMRGSVTVPMSMAMMVFASAGENPGGDDVDAQTEGRDRDRLGEVDGHGREQAVDRFPADEDGDHRQDDGAGEAGEVAKLPGSEAEAPVMRMPARIAVGEGGKQEGPGM